MFKPSGSYNSGHAVFAAGADEVYFCGAINVPADMYLAKISAPTLTGVTPPARTAVIRL